MDIFGVGFPELIFIFIIALMIFGPQRLPEIAAKAGRIVRDLRNMSQGFMTEWQREITAAASLAEIEEARKELEKTRQELQQARTGLASQVSTAKKSADAALTSVVNPAQEKSIKPPASPKPSSETKSTPAVPTSEMSAPPETSPSPAAVDPAPSADQAEAEPASNAPPEEIIPVPVSDVPPAEDGQSHSGEAAFTQEENANSKPVLPDPAQPTNSRKGTMNE